MTAAATAGERDGPAKRGLERRAAVTQVPTDVRPAPERPRQSRCRSPPARARGRIADRWDPGGDKFLEAALAGGADPVVTDDRNLFASDPWQGVRVEVRAALAELPEKG